MNLESIGTVRKLTGDEARVEVHPTFADGLYGIAAGDRLDVLYWMHQLGEEQRKILKVHPQGNRNRPLKGVFGLRSPMRPNPLGVSSVCVKRVEQNALLVVGLDAEDGAPVIDIKVTIRSAPGAPPTVGGHGMSVRKETERAKLSNCKLCGRELSPYSPFCRQCGHPQGSVLAIWILAAVLLVLIVFYVAMTLFCLCNVRRFGVHQDPARSPESIPRPLTEAMTHETQATLEREATTREPAKNTNVSISKKGAAMRPAREGMNQCCGRSASVRA